MVKKSNLGSISGRTLAAATFPFKSLLILGLALALPSTVALSESATGRLPVFHVITEGLTPREVGAALGRQWRASFPRLEQRLDALLAERLENTMLGYDLASRAVPAIARIREPAYRAELEGVASALDLVSRNRLGDEFLSWDELVLVQQLPDFGAHDAGSGFGVYGTHSETGRPLVGRNLDGSTKPSAGAGLGLDAITVYRNSDSTLVNIGFAGTLGVTTGFNERGLFVAYIPASGTPKAMESNAPFEPIGFLLREALETHHSIDQAFRFLRPKPLTSNHSILMADPDRVQVLEHATDRPAFLRDALSEHHPAMTWRRPEQIAVVGCFALKRIPAPCTRLRDRHRWQRFHDLATFDPQQRRAALTDIIRIMLDRLNSHDAINSDATRQVLIFEPHSTVLHLRSKIPTLRTAVEPTLYRYADLATRQAPERSGIFSLWIALLLSIAAISGITLVVRFRRRGSA
jgi:hypothetical protein